MEDVSFDDLTEEKLQRTVIFASHTLVLDSCHVCPKVLDFDPFLAQVSSLVTWSVVSIGVSLHPVGFSRSGC